MTASDIALDAELSVSTHMPLARHDAVMLLLQYIIF